MRDNSRAPVLTSRHKRMLAETRRKTRKNKKRPQKTLLKQMACQQSNDLFQHICFTTISEGQFFKRRIQVSQAEIIAFLRASFPFCVSPLAFAINFNFLFVDQKLTELSKIIGEEWKKLNDDQKKVRSFIIFSSFNRSGQIKLPQ